MARLDPAASRSSVRYGSRMTLVVLWIPDPKIGNQRSRLRSSWGLRLGAVSMLLVDLVDAHFALGRRLDA